MTHTKLGVRHGDATVQHAPDAYVAKDGIKLKVGQRQDAAIAHLIKKVMCNITLYNPFFS